MEQKYLELQQERENAINAELATISNSDEYFAVSRFKGLGGSDMAKLMGVSKYGSPFSLWKDKTERTYKPVDVNSSKWCLFAFGHADEDVIAKNYGLRTGFEVRKAGSVKMRGYPFIVANFDRLICDPTSPENAKTFLGGLECKTCENNSDVLDKRTGEYRKKWGIGNHYTGQELTAIDSNIDPEYYPQVQFYLMVSGLPWWDVAVALGRTEIRIFRVFPDREYQQEMLSRAVNFWCLNVLDHVAPPMTYEDAKTDVTVKTNTAMEATPEMIKDATVYKNITAQMKALEAQQDEIKNKLVAGLGKATKATYVNEEGKVKSLVTFSASGTVERFDSTAFKTEYPDLYKQYTKTFDKSRSMRVY